MAGSYLFRNSQAGNPRIQGANVAVQQLQALVFPAHNLALQKAGTEYIS